MTCRCVDTTVHLHDVPASLGRDTSFLKRDSPCDRMSVDQFDPTCWCGLPDESHNRCGQRFAPTSAPFVYGLEPHFRERPLAAVLDAEAEDS